MKRSIGTVIAVLLVFLCLQVGPANSQPARKIMASYSAISGAMTALWVAGDAGIFRKNGLEVGLVFIASGPKAVAAILAGETPFALAGGSSLVQSRLRGADLVSIADHANTFVFSLMTRPDIKKPADLKGKKLGVARFGSSSHTGLVVALRHYGLDPSRDVAVIQVGGMPEILAAIQAGGVDGGVISPPTNIRAKQMGLNEFLDLGTLQIPYQQNTFIVSESYIRSNPDTVRAFARSIVDAIHLAKTDRSLTRKIIGKYTRVKDEEVLEGTYETFVMKYLKEAPYPSEAAVKTMLDEVAKSDPKASTANLREFIDPRWIRELEESGYIARLYGRR